MTLTAIILILILGLILILLEILVLPGIGISGVTGVALLLLGIILGYSRDTVIGHVVLASTVLSSIAMIILSLRSETWKKVSLNSALHGKVNTFAAEIKTGDTGITVSRLAPVGKALINDNEIEVSSIGELLNAGTKIIVNKVEGNKIFVKQLII